MNFARRRLLGMSAMAALAGAMPRSLQAATAPARSLPWQNWSGAQTAQPAARFAPRSEAELIDYLRTHSGSIRCVGAGHSFSPLVPTDGELLVLDRLAGVIAHDATTRTATVGAGTRLGDLGPLLDGIGQAMFNLPDIDRQTLAGAISTATHGTGIGFTSLSDTVKALRLITPGGDVLDVDANSNAKLFAAARVALGSLGVITRVTLQNRTPFRLHETAEAAKTEAVLEQFDEAARTHRHFEMFPLVHSDYAIVQRIDQTTDAIDNPTPTPEEAAAFDQAMRAWLMTPVRERKALIDGTAQQLPPSTRSDVSYRILANVRNARFNEMEYSVPLANGAACLREILQTIAREQIDIAFPLEYRYVAGDDLWLSMFNGGPRAAISIHQFAQLDYRPYFNAIEPIFWKHGGRPHWGKLHSLGAAQLRSLYPRFDDFLEQRARLDPHGRMLNAHLRTLFGMDA